MTAEGRLAVQLFAHLTVRVTVVESRCHTPSIELELCHFGVDPDEGATGGKVNTTQEVLKQRKAELLRLEEERGAEIIPNLSMELAKVSRPYAFRLADSAAEVGTSDKSRKENS